MAMSMTTERRSSFDRIIAQSQSRSRSNSENSANLLDSLPPPPRRRKPVSPPSLATSSTSSLAMQRPQMSTPGSQLHQGLDSNPFSSPPVADTDPQSILSPFAHWEEGPPAHRYADSLSSLNSYSNLFYKPEDDANASPIIRPADDPPTDRASFDDAASTEDYSDLLYPDLQAPVGPSHSPRPSIEVHGPPRRKRISSFNSHEGPESPVEFANIGALSMPPPLPAFQEHQHRPSKVERLLGMDSQSSSRRGSSDRLLIDQARRDSFMEFDIASFRASPIPSEAALRGQPSIISDEMPIFAPRHTESLLPDNSIGVYKALRDAVDHIDRTEASPRVDSRQILVDGSDRPKPARSALSNQGSNRSSASSPPLESRLSTSNFLDKKERADLVRKNRKIVQVLGPGVVPSTQALARAGRTTPTPETSEIRHDLLHRSTRSETRMFDESKSEGDRKPRTSGLIPHRPPLLQSKSSWSVLEHDTIYLTSNGRRHSSPLNATFDSLGTYQRLDPDANSMSSLGSIIVQEEHDTSKEGARPHTPNSFMEMSDDEGAKTPKRRPSIESTRSPVIQEFQRTQRAASLNDLLTVSSALESPRRVSIPDTLPTDASIRSRSRPISEMTLESSFRGQLSIRDDYGQEDAENEDARMERQRKREKLAKIHRYLGSKVPAELVLGYSSSYSPSHTATNSIAVMERVVVPDVRQQEVKKRRRSSSAVVYQHSYGSSPPRNTEVENRSKDSTLTDVERMTKIRRAQKIEQIFGESPTRPRSLSIPRPSSAQGLMQNQLAIPTTPLKRTTVATPIPEHQPTERGFKPRSPFVWKDGRPSTAGSSRPSTATSTTGLMASYQKDTEREKKSRGKNQQVDTGRANSSKAQFPVGTALGSPWKDVYRNDVLDISANTTTVYSSKSPVMPGGPTSRQYLDYRNSLNSLSRILDHDDRQSLNDLHAVLDSDEEDDDPDLQHPSALQSGSIDIQRMLQPRASLVSINSVATTSTFATLTPDPMAFQARRRRAAKLAQFFGASYRDLFGEVLVRIERGMLEEVRAGQISEEEVKHLMKQLNRLKNRQSQLS